MVADPIQKAAKLEQKALAWNVLSKITFVAIAAICAAVLTVSILLSTTTGTLPFILAGLALTTPFLSVAASKLQAKSRALATEAEFERAVANRFMIIQKWDEPKILKFFDDHSIVPNPNVPLTEFLPLIARYETQNSEANIDKITSDMLLESKDAADREIRLQQRLIGWQILEQRAIPAALNAALILEILSQPTLQLRRLADIGSLTQKSIEERQLDRIYGPNDDYLVFSEERPSLSLCDLVDDLSPDRLRGLLFRPMLA